MHKILCLGTARIDFSFYAGEYPKEGSEVKLNDFSFNIGGSVVNTSLILKQLNVKPYLYTQIGGKELGTLIINELNKQKINFADNRSGSTAALSFILVSRFGERTIFSYDNSYLKINNDNPFLDPLKYDAVFTSCYEICSQNIVQFENLFKSFLLKGKLTFLDLSPLTGTIPKEIWCRVLPHIEVLIGTKNELEILQSLLHFNSFDQLFKYFELKKVYIKMGELGSCLRLAGGLCFFKEVEKVSAKNLSGCGDAYNAGIIWGELRKQPHERILENANYLGRQVAKNGFKPAAIVQALTCF